MTGRVRCGFEPGVPLARLASRRSVELHAERRLRLELREHLVFAFGVCDFDAPDGGPLRSLSFFCTPTRTPLMILRVFLVGGVLSDARDTLSASAATDDLDARPALILADAPSVIIAPLSSAAFSAIFAARFAFFSASSASRRIDS